MSNRAGSGGGKKSVQSDFLGGKDHAPDSGFRNGKILDLISVGTQWPGWGGGFAKISTSPAGWLLVVPGGTSRSAAKFQRLIKLVHVIDVLKVRQKSGPARSTGQRETKAHAQAFQ